MDQPAFAGLEFQNKKRKTRREVFLEQLDTLIGGALPGPGQEPETAGNVAGAGQFAHGPTLADYFTQGAVVPTSSKGLQPESQRGSWPPQTLEKGPNLSGLPLQDYGLTKTVTGAAASDPWGRPEGWASDMGTSW